MIEVTSDDVKVTQIDFDVIELWAGNNIGDEGAELPDTKEYYLRLHVRFEFKSLVNETTAGTASSNKYFKIAEVDYDYSSLNKKDPVITSFSVEDISSLTAEQIISDATDLAVEKAQTLLNEEFIYSSVNSALNTMNTLKGIPHLSANTGLKTIETGITMRDFTQE